MTIGIAAKSFGSHFIVTVTDMRIGLGPDIPALDQALFKRMLINPYWGFLYAANELGYVEQINQHLVEELRGAEGRLTLSQVSTALVNAYQKVRSDTVFKKDLRVLGYESMEQFRQIASKEFSDEVMLSLIERVNNFDLGVMLLLYGFDEKGRSHFVQIQNPGEELDRDYMTSWAIGSGRTMAMAMLNSRDEGEVDPAAWVYRCCEAKFVAELSNRDVGRPTSVMIFYPDGTFALLPNNEIEQIRSIYEQERGRSIPEEADAILHASLENQRKRRQIELAQRAKAASSSEGKAAC